MGRAGLPAWNRATQVLLLLLLVLGGASASIADPLEFLGVVQDGIDGVEELRSPLSVTTSPDGRHVYAVSHGHIVVFARDEETGLLTFVEAEGAVGSFPMEKDILNH